MGEQLYSADEAAQILGLQVRTVRNYVREGRLPGVRIGKQYRIARADLEAFTAGLGPREAAAAPTAPLPPPEPTTWSGAEVSSVVQLDGIAASAADRLERTLVAACVAGTGAGVERVLRVEPIYDEDRRRLRLIIVGSPADVADLLRIVDRFTREPGSHAGVPGT